MTSFTKSDLAAALSNNTDLTTAQAMRYINALTTVIRQESEAGKTVQIAGFGKFQVRERAARMGRNPATGEPIQIPASRALTFKPSKSST